MRQTEFDKLIAESKFNEAMELLKSELASGRVIDPRSDRSWPKIADYLVGRLQESRGAEVVADFWNDFADFFVNKIEPDWGHAHKGHIYFRLGIALLPSNLPDGKECLIKAYRDDCLLEEARNGWPKAQDQSAYVALAILDRIDEADFVDDPDKTRFLKQLFTSLNAVLDEAHLEPRQITDALKAIAPHEALPSCLSIYEELRNTINRMMPFATVSLAGMLLEALIFSELHYRRGMKNLPCGKDIRKAKLGDLFKEAVRLSVFPTNSIKVSFQLIHMFRNRVHPGNEVLQTYKLVPRVARTVKVLFELAILEWGRTLIPNVATIHNDESAQKG
ncbi:MAG: hypothetical protein OJF50_000960 [Nitrospira sp.]|jgi:hypothetical protein|nr:hypothetical protein [Nitrospira sp.]